MDVEGNKFNAVAVVHSEVRATTELKESGVTPIVD